MRNVRPFVAMPLLVFGAFAFVACSSVDEQEEETITCVHTHALPQAVTLPSGVTVIKSDGKYFFEGDVELTEAQFENLSIYGELNAPGDTLHVETDLSPFICK